MKISKSLAEKMYKQGATVYITTGSEECLNWCRQDGHPNTLKSVIDEYYRSNDQLLFTVQAAVKGADQK